MTYSQSHYKWLQGDDYDAARVMGTYAEVLQQFFQHHQFVVLPYATTNSIFLPALNYKTYLTASYKPTYHTEAYPKEVLESLSTQLLAVSKGKYVEMNTIQEEFEIIKLKFEKSLQNLFPILFPKISSISVIVTKYGTEGSFDYKKEGNAFHIFIWIRSTGNTKNEIIAQLIHCIVSAFVLISTKISDSNTQIWKQREAIVDFLLEHTQLCDLWTHIHKTLNVIESKQKSHKLMTESQQYLKKLSTLLQPPHISKQGNVFKIDSFVVENLNFKEEQLFDLLYTHRNSFVDKDTLFDHLYGEEGGSDWALSKVIERLRNKILLAGIDYPVLITSRKQGYKLACR